MLYSDNEETMPSRKNNYKWLVQCINMINAYEEDARRQEVGGVIAALLYIMPKKRHYTKKNSGLHRYLMTDFDMDSSLLHFQT